MSASVERIQRSPRRNAAAEKARRQKIIAIAGVVVLAVLLVIQVPRTLKMLKSSSGGSPTTAAVPTPATVPAATPKTEAAPEPSKALKVLLRSAATDPFRVRAVGSNDPAPRAVSSSSALRDPFTARSPSGSDPGPRAVGAPAGLRDPFLTPTAAPGPIERIVIGTPGKHGAASVGYIVVLASIPLSEGRGAAVRFAAQVRTNGIRGVVILNSSSRKPLRHGYWVVFIGSYKTFGAAAIAATRVHGLGYRTAYLRQLVRYG